MAIRSMPRTILCQNCGVVLNLNGPIPIGKRMKCPKCNHRFAISDKDASSESTAPGIADAASLTSIDAAKRPPSHDELPVRTGDQDLRGLFDLPMGTAEDLERSAVAGSKPVVSDAEALFKEEPVRKKKPKGAEARAQARRCTYCGGVVPQGMSICLSCGTDQETGVRAGLEDDLAPPEPVRSSGPPLHIAIVGWLCGLSGAVLLLLSLIQSIRVESGPVQYGWLCLALVSAFGVYGAVQFLAGKTMRMLLIALTLGAFVNFFSLIVIPILQANLEATENVVTRVASGRDDPEILDDAEVHIKPIAERIDQQKITLGLIVLGVYSALAIYLLSPPVKRHFARHAFFANASVPLV